MTALSALIFVFTAMNNDPSKPLNTPNTTAPISTSDGVTSTVLTYPNLSEEAVQDENLPCARASNTAMKNTAHEHDRKVFHKSENFQKG